MVCSAANRCPSRTAAVRDLPLPRVQYQIPTRSTKKGNYHMQATRNILSHSRGTILTAAATSTRIHYLIRVEHRACQDIMRQRTEERGKCSVKRCSAGPAGRGSCAVSSAKVLLLFFFADNNRTAFVAPQENLTDRL